MSLVLETISRTLKGITIKEREAIVRGGAGWGFDLVDGL